MKRVAGFGSHDSINGAAVGTNCCCLLADPKVDARDVMGDGIKSFAYVVLPFASLGSRSGTGLPSPSGESDLACGPFFQLRSVA